MSVLSIIEQYGVLPIIKMEKAEHAPKLAKALKAANLPVGEVVFRTPNANEVIRGMLAEYPEMTLGAGTILTNAQVDCAMEAGASFMISPGMDPELTDYCLQKGTTPIPGCGTASEVQLCVKRGLRVVKLFPARFIGGVDFIHAIAAPFAGIKYIPTNGVGFETLEEYASSEHVCACAGIYPCPDQLIREEKWDEITALCIKAVETVKKARAQARTEK